MSKKIVFALMAILLTSVVFAQLSVGRAKGIPLNTSRIERSYNIINITEAGDDLRVDYVIFEKNISTVYQNVLVFNKDGSNTTQTVKQIKELINVLEYQSTTVPTFRKEKIVRNNVTMDRKANLRPQEKANNIKTRLRQNVARFFAYHDSIKAVDEDVSNLIGFKEDIQ